VRSTYTYAELAVSQATYDEIAQKLRAAGYDQAFHTYDNRTIIDMHGIGLVPDGWCSKPRMENAGAASRPTSRCASTVRRLGSHGVKNLQNTWY
jgi:hypothetical protein